MSGRQITECACGKLGRFKTTGICSACKKAEDRVYDPDKQKEYFDRWYTKQRVDGYPSYNWKTRNAKKERPTNSAISPQGTED